MFRQELSLYGGCHCIFKVETKLSILVDCIHIRNSMACVGGFKTCSDKNCHCMVVAIVYLK